MEKLGVLFSEQLLLAALDLIDRDCGKGNNHRHPYLLETKTSSYESYDIFICVHSTVIKYVTPWCRSHFSVLGMTGSYAVFPSLHQSCSIPFFCTCPAFSYAVLISHSQITVRVPSPSKCIRSSLMRQGSSICPQCKHVLATLIAQRLSKCVVREMNKDEFVTLLARQTSDT